MTESVPAPAQAAATVKLASAEKHIAPPLVLAESYHDHCRDKNFSRKSAAY
ncbi:hypothetical protein [Henriciella aquimarina]|jgi:hypothetical protein|uniref:hypothetical protein n=1 Tax=Henriciella aquimarina TaxID=545261 RepID=UPI001301C26A|nr:hypothetical protein [Henriciella aquimarina]